MNSAVILLGSNTGERSVNLDRSLTLINENAGVIVQTSSVYETEPWGNTEQPVFFNRVIVIHTNLDARSLMKKLLDIEHQMGRVRSQKWSPRLIDLDILYFNDEIINEAGLTIPHPHLHERRFTMEPLCEILPDKIHPVLQKKNKEILNELTDRLKVNAITQESTLKSGSNFAE